MKATTCPLNAVMPKWQKCSGTGRGRGGGGGWESARAFPEGSSWARPCPSSRFQLSGSLWVSAAQLRDGGLQPLLASLLMGWLILQSLGPMVDEPWACSSCLWVWLISRILCRKYTQQGPRVLVMMMMLKITWHVLMGIPSGPVVRTPCLHCQRRQFNPGWGIKIL